MPVRNTARGNKSKYPFETLTEVGMCFAVKGRTALQLSSVISNINRKFTTTTVGAPGAEPEKVSSKHFFAVDVTAAEVKVTVHEGATARIFRDI